MEVSIISREIVKPSSLPLGHNLKPYKLCLFDQLTPMTYASIILFYRFPDPNLNISETLTNLKKSLSETLTLFFPFSGKTKDNLYVEEFDSGVPFLEAKVSCSLSEFFKLNQTELLDQLATFPPFRNNGGTSSPQIAFQVNIFDGNSGMALATSLGHKVGDGGTLAHFLTSWAASFRGSKLIIKPNVSDASLVFPPRDLSQNYPSLMDKLWFNEGSFVTRRFVFDAKAIATLREIGRSESVPKPSRNEALTCFVWKHAMAACWAVYGEPRASIAAHAVNMRPRMRSHVLDTAIGNLFWWARATVEPRADQKEVPELDEMVRLLREALVGFNKEYLEKMEGEVGFEAVSDFMSEIEKIVELEKMPDIFGFTNWNGFFNDVDFGWGKPIWVGAHGKVGKEFRNLVIFVDGQGGKGHMEAFLTMEEKQMAILESDSEFLKFASPNPKGTPNCV